MTDEQLARLRVGFTAVLRVVSAGGRVVVNDNYGESGEAMRYPGTLPYLAVHIGVHWPAIPTGQGKRLADLTPAQLLGLAVLLKDEAVIPQVLADFLLDAGHEYATAVAEKARREEREAIAERLYSESAHQLGLAPDPRDTYEYAAAVLSTIADDLVFGVPPTAPATTPPPE